jgi:predicted DNA-binding protein
MPKGTKDRIQAAADQQDIKASQFIRNAIEKALQEAEKLKKSSK